MKKILLLPLSCILYCIVSCVPSSKYNALQNEYNDLRQDYEETDSTLIALSSYLDTLSTSIELVAVQEDIVRLGVNADGESLSRDERIESLHTLEALIDRQKNTIKDLEMKLAGQESSMKQLNILVKNLYAQLEQKEKELNTLRSEIMSNKATINKLNKKVDGLERENSDNREIIRQQEEILDTQNKMLNEGYVIIASRKELQKMGILKPMSNKLITSKLSPEIAEIVDIREYTEATLSSRNAKILSNNPVGSYTLEKTAKGSILKITSPADFWSYSSYLVITLN